MIVKVHKSCLKKNDHVAIKEKSQRKTFTDQKFHKISFF